VNEPDVIRRAQRGDDGAWELLIEAHQVTVFRLAYLLLGDASEAEDIAQEAFVHAWRALDRFDAMRPLRPWLLQITANLARNKRRSMGRYIHALHRLVTFAPEPVHSDDVETGQHWEAQTLWQAVRRLGTTDQEILYMRYFLELSEAEMATALRIAPGTVKSRLHRAMARLRGVVTSEFPALREEREL
jgi:RNA polymerase sigma-70 factor (ECF subfamily)